MATIAVTRKTEPPIVDAVRYLHYSTPVLIGKRPTLLYEIGDSFPLIVKSAEAQYGPLRCDKTDTIFPPDFVAVVVRRIVDDSILLPTMEPLISFPPVPGMGFYQSNIRASVIFWDNSFWSPVLAVEPSREELFSRMYGDLALWGLDVLHKIEVAEIPDIDPHFWEKWNDPATSPWVGGV